MLTIHKASAGSGKTFSLARKYLKLLLFKAGADGDLSDVDNGWTEEDAWSDPARHDSAVFLRYRDEYVGRRFPKAHRHILAITFTNKATNEMTDRIIEELEQLRAIAEPGDGSAPWDGSRRPRNAHIHYLVGVYCGATGHDDDPEAVADALWDADRDSYIRRVREISHGAGLALADILVNFTDFNVSTIDSFFQSVLHVFTRELELPENFDLQIDEGHAIRMAVDQMLNNVKSDFRRGSDMSPMHGWLRQYMLHIAQTTESQFNVFSSDSSVNQSLVSDVSKLRGEFFKKNIEQFNRYFYPDGGDRLNLGPLLRFTAWLRERTSGAPFTQLQAEAASVVGDPSADMVATTVMSALKKWAAGDFSAAPSATVVNAAGLGEKEVAVNRGGKKIPAGWTGEFELRVRDVCRRGVELLTQARFYRTLLGRCFLLGLFAEACNSVEQFCREHDMFFLGDTNSLLGQVIKDEEVPFVYEKMGTQLNHLLIDEFQDTSEMNWDNLRPLVEETLGRGRENLIIGDVKQSIYRFRNARPELLGSEVSKSLGGYEIREIGQDVKDNTNWRSAREVVTFNNSLFTALAARFEGTGPEATYRGVVQRVAHRDTPGFVEMFLNDSDGDFNKDRQLELLGANILRQLRQGFTPSQIGVLVRSGDDGQRVVDYILSMKKNDPGWLEYQRRSGRRVEVISNDAMTIGSSQSVKSVVNLLRLCVTPPEIEKPVKGEPAATEKVQNPAWLRNRMMQIFEVLLLKYPPRDALWKAVSATSPTLGCDPDSEAAEVRDLIDALLADLADDRNPDLFLLTERIIRDFVIHADRRTSPVSASEVAFITAFQDMVLDFCDNGDPNIASFLKWWDRTGCRRSFPEADIPDAITVMTIHKSKGLEIDCVHVPFCDKAMVKSGDTTWYTLDRNGFPGCDPADVPPFIPLDFSHGMTEFDMLRKQTEAIERSARIDALNVAYVAFTRARYELAVYGDAVPARSAADGDACKALGQNLLRTLDEELRGDRSLFGRFALEGEQLDYVDAIGNYFTDPAPYFRHLFHFDGDDDSLYDPVTPLPAMPRFRYLRYGEPVDTSRFPASEKKEARYPAASDYLPAGRIEYSSRRRRKVESPASFDSKVDYDSVRRLYRSADPPVLTVAADARDSNGVFDLANPVHRGTFLHEVLASVKRPADLDRAFVMPAYRRHLTEADYAPWRERLRRALADPRVNRYFTGFTRVMNERPLTNFAYFNAPDNSASGLPMVLRPDRVAVMPDGETAVIDYKFGRPEDDYENQVREYCALLVQAGYTNVNGYLFYPFSTGSRFLVPV